ncbi:MAG: hypothetical protein M3N33_08320 [Actinomycetota bacterium]|nr:hypothetical protein [Actinomycetota bacterium]
MHFLPWWALLACLAASAVAAYLLIERTRAGDSPWTRFPLAVALAPVVLAGAAVAALVLSTLLSTRLEDQIGEPRVPPSEPPTRTEGTSPAPEGTSFEATSEERTVPAAGSPSASPGASPSASASASASP